MNVITFVSNVSKSDTFTTCFLTALILQLINFVGSNFSGYSFSHTTFKYHLKMFWPKQNKFTAIERAYNNTENYVQNKTKISNLFLGRRYTDFKHTFQWEKSPKKQSEGVRFASSALKIQCHNCQK